LLATPETWLSAALIYFGAHSVLFLAIQTSGAVSEAVALRGLTAALQDVDREHQRLREEAARLSDRDEVIRLARKQEGLIFPGEETYRVPAEEPKPESPEERPAARRVSRASEFWQGLRRILFPKSAG
jgi:cell division protein FtsB